MLDEMLNVIYYCIDGELDLEVEDFDNVCLGNILVLNGVVDWMIWDNMVLFDLLVDLLKIYFEMLEIDVNLIDLVYVV